MGKGKIIIDPKIMLGKPIIAGTRITVEHVLKLVAQGMAIEEILEDYPHLTKKDIKACLSYASKKIEEERVYPLGTNRKPITLYP